MVLFGVSPPSDFRVFRVFRGLLCQVAPHSLLAAQQGNGVVPAVVPGPAVAGVVGGEVLGLPGVAAVTLRDQRAGQPLAWAAWALVSSGMPRRSKNSSLVSEAADSADHLPSFSARKAAAARPVSRSRKGSWRSTR